jgi:hypothetical protein
MEQFFAILKVAMQLLPMVTEMVKAIENAVPANGQGAAKLEMVRKMLESAYGQAQDASVQFSAIWPVLSSMVGGIVTLYNTSGVFTKKQ